MDKLEEAALIRRCQAGDREAFRVLAEMHERSLFGIAFLMTHDRERSADLVQETLLKMWQHLASLRAEKGLKPWLVRVLVNRVREQARKKTVPEAPIGAADTVADPSEGAASAMERGELHAAIRAAVEKLPPNQREAVVLRYFGDLSIAEMAAAMGCSQGTAKSRLSRALDRLETILGASGPREVV